MMTVANEELLRLARKAFPLTDWDALPLSDSGKVIRLTGAVTNRLKVIHLAPGREEEIAKQRAALHAALLVLAGELDIEALTSLRAHPRLEELISSADDCAHNWRACAEDSDSPDEEPCREACLEKAEAWSLLLKLLRGEP